MQENDLRSAVWQWQATAVYWHYYSSSLWLTLIVSYKHSLRQAVSDHTDSQKIMCSVLKSSYSTSPHSFLSKSFFLLSFSSSQNGSCSMVTIYDSIILQTLSILILAPLFSSLSVYYDRLIPLWSTMFLHLSLSLTLSQSLLPQCVVPLLLLLPLLSPVPSLSLLFLPPSCSLFITDLLWEGYLYSNNPRRRGEEQNRAVKAVWLAKMDITSETKQKLFFYLVYAWFLCPQLSSGLLFNPVKEAMCAKQL